ncbi:MAG TPA: DUF58 domain-containing protein [Rhodanobacteraceae bacterium]|nr:DUF58 domain-containing protein [Rhodanobacteraceae bacterium]
MSAAIAGLRTRILLLAERRLPALTRLREPETLPIRLDRRRIYVLPTRFGLGFGALLFVMLLGALNYGNNPAFLLTCLLGAAAWASLFLGFRTMAGLSIRQMRAGETHAGDLLHVECVLEAGQRRRESLRLRCGRAEIAFALPAGIGTTVVLGLPSERRGWFRAGRLRVWTDYPLGLFRCWSWIHPATEFLVYARAEPAAPPLPRGGGHSGERMIAGASEDYVGLRDYRTSDPPRLIAWKASARHDTLLVRETERHADVALVLDYALLAGLDSESRISRLTAWVLAAEAEQRDYTLRLPDRSIGPGAGRQQCQACLRALALYADD